MSDEYQTRQFFNMKHSELKQIIKEEIHKVLNENNNIESNKLPLREIAQIVGNKDFVDLYDIQFKVYSLQIE